MILGQHAGDVCQNHICMYNPDGICCFGGRNCGLTCPELSGMSYEELCSFADLRLGESSSKRYGFMQDIWQNDLEIAGRRVPGRLVLKYCATIRGTHIPIFGAPIETREHMRRGFHLLICELAGTTHDDKEFNEELEKVVEEILGKVEPHFLARYQYKKETGD